MKRIIRLTERDLTRIVKRVINERQYLMEEEDNSKLEPLITNWINKMNSVYGSTMKLNRTGNDYNITGGARDYFMYSLPLVFPDDKAKIRNNVIRGFGQIKSDMAGQNPTSRKLYMTCIPKLSTTGGKTPVGCEDVLTADMITKGNALNTAYDNLLYLLTPGQ